MVFHNACWLDVVKMIRLNVPYRSGEMALSERAGEAVSLVEGNLADS